MTKFKDLFSKIYGARESLVLAFFAAWAAYLSLSALGAGSAVALIFALFGFLVITLSAFSSRPQISLIIGRGMLFAFVLLLCAKNVSAKSDIYLLAGNAAAMGVVSLYCFRSADKLGKISDSKAVWISVSAVLTVSFICVLSAITVARYITYRAPTFDFGIFAQAFYSMKERFLPITTCERGYELSHFAVHLSPVMYLALPIYALFPRPETVQIIQALALASGVIPLWLLAKRLNISKKAAALFSFVYLFHPALIGGCMYDFHENCFLPALILWTLYFAEKKNIPLSMLFALLTCSVKEDAAVYVAFIGIFMLLSGRRKRIGIILTVLSVGYFLVACAYLESKGLGVMAYRYDNISSDGSLFGVIVTALRDPLKIFKEITELEKLKFAFLMLLPLGFLPFATKKISHYVLFGGIVLVNLMTDYQYQYSMDFQYVFGSFALLFYLSVLNFSELKGDAKRSLAVFAASACVLTSAMRLPTQMRYVKFAKQYAEEIATLDSVMEMIPDGASVSASTFLTAHLSSRDVLYEIADGKETDYAVVDMRGIDGKYGMDYVNKYKKLGYEIIYEESRIVTVLKKP
ncbi:MAG: DUF2079 domain-containing protein [Clostridia bacterium]|nr:DUF2079 domain-containing protein [Clostridia bacterium]